MDDLYVIDVDDWAAPITGACDESYLGLPLS